MLQPGAPVPDNEYERLLALARYNILDTLPEAAFDRITALASELLDVPVAIINFVDQHRQWGKSCVGIADSEAPRAHSMCAWTILSDEPLVVADARADERFVTNPMVLGEPHIHMYAGAPLITPSGHRIGTLCVTDDKPHPFGPREQRALQRFAEMVVDELELRLRTLELEREVGAQAYTMRQLRRTLAHAETLAAVNTLMDIDLSPEEAALAAADLIGHALDADWTGLVTAQGDTYRSAVARHRPGINATFLELMACHTSTGLTGRALSSARPLFVDDYPLHADALPEYIEAGVTSAVWIPLGTRGATTYLLMAVRLDRPGTLRWTTSDRALLEAAGRTIRGALERHPEMAGSPETNPSLS